MGIFVTNDMASRSFQNDKHVDRVHAELAVTHARLTSLSLNHNGIQLNTVIHPHAEVEQVLVHISKLSEN